MNISLCVCVYIKTILWKSHILNPKNSRVISPKFVKSLKSRLIFNIFYFSRMFVNKLFSISLVRSTQKVKDVLMWNFQHIFIWRRRYLQIFKSALMYLWANLNELINFCPPVNHQKTFVFLMISGEIEVD